MIELRWLEQEARELPEGGDAFDFDFGQLQLDIAESDSYEVTSLITAHSVENHEQITDHQVPQLDKASVEILLSESPSDRTIGEGTSYAEIRLASGTTASVITVPEGVTRGVDAFDTLRRLCREGINVDVEGLRRPLEGWLLEAVSSPRDVPRAGVLSCTISFIEVSVATATTVDAPSPRVERGRRGQSRGRVAPVPTQPTPAVEDTFMTGWTDPATGVAW
jgi:hypothetical protein